MLLTYGHGTESIDDTVRILSDADVMSLIDIRSKPHSKRHPQFEREALELWLPANHIKYTWLPDLGGFRPGKGDLTLDSGLTHARFRSYASWMRTDRFTRAADRVVRESERCRTAVMCSETLWWRCHRMLFADYIQLGLGVGVGHLMHDGKVAPFKSLARPSARDGLLYYDGGQEELF